MKTDSATGPSLGPKVWKDSPGCAVQVQTVVPVSAANEGKPVRTLMGYGKMEGTCQMLKQGAFAAVVKGYHFIQN